MLLICSVINRRKSADIGAVRVSYSVSGHLIKFVLTRAAPVLMRFSVLHLFQFKLAPLGISCTGG